MRNAFAAEITACAAQDSRLVLLSGDIGNRLFDPFKAQYPARLYNCGVAEANMIGVAAGLALGGLKPVVYTSSPFYTARAFEQIKLDVCQQNLPVVLVGGAGLAYASLNPTHHTFEDLAALRALPNLSIICPGDAWEVRAGLRAALAHPGPVYIRIGKKGEPVVHQNMPSFEIGKAMVIQPGSEVCLLSTGTLLPGALAAAAELAGQGISAQVVSFHTVKPLDGALLAQAFAVFGWW
jgi:transketolase